MAENLENPITPFGLLGHTGTGSPADEVGIVSPAAARALLNVADGATANASDASLRDRITHTGTQATSTITGLDAALALLAPLASPPLTGTPTAPTAAPGTNTAQLATTAFVEQRAQAIAAGLAFKDSVRVATTANGALATAFENGDTVDGVVLATGNRILLKNQTAPAENGIRVVAASGAPARAADADAFGELVSACIFVEQGTANADTSWVCNSDVGGTIDADPVTFVQFGASGALADGDKGDITVTGAGTIWTVEPGAITNAKRAAMVQSTISGRAAAAGTGDPTDLSATQVRTIINVEDGATADQTGAEIATAYHAQVPVVSQAVAEAGVSTAVATWTAQRVAQAIAALAAGGGGSGGGSDLNSVVNVGTPGTSLGTTEVAIGTVSITPSSSTAKILVIASCYLTKDTGTVNRIATGRLRRGAAVSGVQVGGDIRARSTPATATTSIASTIYGPITLAYVDSPATTLATTYSLCGLVDAGNSNATGFHMLAIELTGGGASTVLSVKDFGAVGNGSTNDAAAILAAITAANAAGGGTIVFPNGTYAIGTAGIHLDTLSDIRLVGEGGAKLLATGVMATSMTSLGAYMIYLDGCTNCSVEGLEVDAADLTHGCIGLELSTDCRIVNNRLNSSGHVNAQLSSIGGTRNLYSGNLVNGPEVGIGCRGIWVGHYNAAGQREFDSKILENHVADHGATGIVAFGSNILVQGNTSRDNQGSGIIYTGFGGVICRGMSVIGNHCQGNLFHGIQMDISGGAPADFPIANIVSGNQCWENDGSGIYWVNVIGGTISNNICWDNNSDAASTGSGIVIGETAARVTVTGNQCFDTRSGASRTQTNGITVTSAAVGGVTDVTIIGNNCWNNLTQGISVSTAGVNDTIDRLSLIGNITNNNGTNGIHVAEGGAGKLTRIKIIGNHGSGNTTYDLRATNDDAFIWGNSFTLQTGVNYDIFDALDTTPNIWSRPVWRCSNASATTITAFDNCQIGHSFTVLFTTGNTTIDCTGTNIRSTSGADLIPAANTSLSWYYDGTTFWQTDGAGSGGGASDSESVTYLPPYTGSVSRTAESKLGESVSVRDFGAVGNGTTDDRTAINAAFTYACTAGCDVRFPPGVYRVTGQLLVGNLIFGTDFSGLISETYASPQDAGERTANAGKYAPSILGCPGAVIWGDFTPSVSTPILYYGMVFSSGLPLPLHRPVIADLNIVGKPGYTAGVVNSPPGENALTATLQIGLVVLRVGMVRNVSFRELQVGLASSESYWTKFQDMIAWRCELCYRFAGANATSADNLLAYYSNKGFIIEGGASTFTNFHTQLVREDIIVPTGEHLTIGPGYLEDTSAVDGTGYSCVRTGITSGGNNVQRSKLTGVRMGSTRTNKGGMRIWGSRGLCLENMNGNSKTMTLDSVSSGSLINCTNMLAADFDRTKWPLLYGSIDGRLLGADTNLFFTNMRGGWANTFSAPILLPGQEVYADVTVASVASQDFVQVAFRSAPTAGTNVRAQGQAGSIRVYIHNGSNKTIAAQTISLLFWVFTVPSTIYSTWSGNTTSLAGGEDTATTTQLADITHAINTTGKYIGRRVFNTTTSKLVAAVAATAAGVWANTGTGATEHTPA